MFYHILQNGKETFLDLPDATRVFAEPNCSLQNASHMSQHASCKAQVATASLFLDWTYPQAFQWMAYLNFFMKIIKLLLTSLLPFTQLSASFLKNILHK